TADRTAELLLRGRGVLIEGVLLRPVAVAVHVEERPFQGVRARLGDRVDETARRAAELRGVARGDDLKFLNGFLRHRERVVRALAAADAAEERLVVVRAVDAHVRVDAALAGERQLTALRIDLHGRRQR